MENYPRISSRKNERVVQAAALGASPEARATQGRYLIEGARLCADAAASGVPIAACFITAAALEKYGSYFAQVRAVCQDIHLVEAHVAQKLAQTKGTQGMFCVCEMRNMGAPVRTGRLVVLEELQDPANLGAVLRTAEAFGVSGVYLAGAGADVYAPRTLRASMGAVFRLPVFRYAETLPLLRELHAAGCETFAAVPDASAERAGSFRFPQNAALFIGNEGNGLQPETITACSRRVTIPMVGRAESLNAAAAAAVLIWEMTDG